jgi:hypothetical protein
MASRAVLAAIARAVDRGGSIDEAFAALSGIDPLLRSGARRRLREAHADAVLATPGWRSGQGEHGALHVMRVTYLYAARAVPGPDQIADALAVAAAYEAARAHMKPAPRLWWATALLVVGVALGAGVGGLAALRASRPPQRADAAQRATVPPGGAYADGGKPDANALVSHALERDVPGYLIALDRWSQARRKGGDAAEIASIEEALAQARAGALAPEVRAAFGERGARCLEDLLARARAAAESPAGPSGDAAGDALMQSLGALNDALAGAGLGYFVDGDVIERTDGDRRLVIIYTFSVEGVTLFQVSRGTTPAALAAGDDRVRSLHLRRLDHLNWTHTLLGFTRPHLREAVVLLDQVDENLVTYVLPGLGPDASVELFDDDDAAMPPGAAAVRARAGELVRTEYAAAPGLDRAAAARLGLGLARRRALFDGWQARVRARGITVQEPTTLKIGLDYGKALRGLVPDAELDELTAIDAELGDAHLTEVYAQLREVLVRSVERHEVQHRVDFARDDPGFMPKALARYVGPAERNGEERRHAALARDELSAYLGELARDEQTPRVNLSMLSRFLFKRRMWGTPECYAALVILEGLAAELTIPIANGAGLLQGGQIDRDALATAYLAITAREGSELRAAARRLWEKLFEGELPGLKRQ